MKAALLVLTMVAITGAMAPAAPADASFRKKTKRAQEGSLRAQLTYRLDSGPLKTWDHGRLRIWSRGRLIVNHAPAGLGYFGGISLPGLSIRQLDGTGLPEVIVDTYSGGVHCCFETTIFTGKHRTKKLWGHYGAPTLRDVDGDGKPEYHGFDARFAAAFGSFGGSRFPAKVWSYSGNALHDVTSSYPAEVQSDMAQQYSEYQAAVANGGGELVQSTLAAYAADGFTLGQGEAAMGVVRAAVDAGETDDPDFTSDVDYLTRLTTMLRDLGYDKSAG